MPASQLNIEYWFRLLYELIFGQNGRVELAQLTALAAHLWLWVIIVGYTLAVAGLFVIIYATVKLADLRNRENEFYGEIILAPDAGGGDPRWKHIQDLMNGQSSSDWRTAILEADILLEDMLTRQGYTGDGVGEKLKQVERSDFATLDDAWEAHKVRNQIAHEGSSFDLSQTLANRTIARYEAVFREFELI